MTQVNRNGAMSASGAQAATRPGVDAFSPTTGQTVNFTNDASDRLMLLTPTAGIAALTIVMPTSTQAVAGQRCTITTSQSITTVSVSGSTVNGLVSGMSASDMYTYMYIGSNTWRREL